MTNPEGAVRLPSFQRSCQLLIQAKQVALTVRAGPNEPGHCAFCMTLHIICGLDLADQIQESMPPHGVGPWPQRDAIYAGNHWGMP